VDTGRRAAGSTVHQHNREAQRFLDSGRFEPCCFGFDICQPIWICPAARLAQWFKSQLWAEFDDMNSNLAAGRFFMSGAQRLRRAGICEILMNHGFHANFGTVPRGLE
jgi:hypothetical protein